ncbi:MAG: xanthine dehydrogenase family protein molybdopterin-binding subunit [Acidimicrobiia bacterium]|nr:xanthine dehydrogenase family protein molybdopterin-binding subunit [bacterium]MXZ30186.1 xanthine dehydrogenase family protein molybdopterin-binding subunit [Acidimicrobiia bacterium]MYB24232.1 xanthine dehydrogenase family protein molybdopterin-binding subunit [Acidimicrobiia bacterium]MYE67240.1 xanthine dehydrogenase family protein molybdopterin-binding subunit [Acidimicrobiia bacterium]
MTITDQRPGYRYVGTRPVRHDGLDKVVGKARYAADLVLPGMLYGHILRSPHAHARIVAIDTAAAEAMPGVRAVITGADFPELPADDPERNTTRNLMARDKVLYEGHAIAAVAATSQRAAKAAAKAIAVTYEVLPHTLDIREAMAPGAPLLHDDVFTTGLDSEPSEPSNVANRTCYERGDIEQGFADAAVVVEGEFVTKAVHQGYIEPHACVADTGQDGKTVIWCSSQGHFRVRSQTAAMLGWDTARIKVIPAEIGGGFGGKTTIYLEPLAVALSARAGRPVKLVMSREEVFRATGPTPGSVIRLKLGAADDGKITAAKAWMAYESGAFPGPWAMLGCMCVISPYNVENFLIEGYEVVVNKPVNVAYRAPSAPMAAFAADTLVDEIARRLDMDPIELRLLNCPSAGDQAPYGPKWPRIGLRECLEAVRDSDHYRSEPAPGHGRGVASGFWFNIGEASSATVNLNENGTATVVTGSPDIGGSRASMALMAAEELGIDVYDIQPVVGDTEVVGFTDVTEGSRATFATGMAVVEACRDLKRQLCGRAAVMWDCDSDEVAWSDGQATHRAGEHEPLALAAITAEAGRTGGPLGATASLNARGAGPAFSVQVTDVSVDEETGRVTVERYTTAQDAGTAIHPDYVEGQMQGGVAQGIGWALNEEYIHDADGVMENPGFLDYRIPVASDLPMIETIIVEVPNPNHPYGVRGVGEVGIVPPIPALANAVYDATGARIRELPLSPPRVLAAITARNGDGG